VIVRFSTGIVPTFSTTIGPDMLENIEQIFNKLKKVTLSNSRAAPARRRVFA
jgi:hypothetical protein